MQPRRDSWVGWGEKWEEKGKRWDRGKATGGRKDEGGGNRLKMVEERRDSLT